MHYHTNVLPCVIDNIICEIDKKTKEEKKSKILKNYTRGRVAISLDNIVAGEKYDVIASLGRITLRDEGRTIGIGKVLKYKPL